MLTAALIAFVALIGTVTGLAVLEWAIAGLYESRREKARRGERADISNLH